MKEQRIRIGEIALQIREYPHDGESIIFLHFGGGNLMMWQSIVPFFKDDYHLVLFDLKGHGKSDRPKTGYHIDEMSRDVIQIMDLLGIHKFHIIGSSLGAEVGLSLAANHPDRALSLVCDGALFSESGPHGRWEGTDEEFNKYALERLEKIRTTQPTTYPTVDALIEASRKVFEEYGWWSDDYEAVMRYDAIQLENGEFISSWSLISENYTRHYLFTRMEDYYRKLQCPVLMLSDNDPGQDQREKEIMHAFSHMAGQSKIVALPRWVHPFGWMLTPQPVSEAILTFLGERIGKTTD